MVEVAGGKGVQADAEAALEADAAPYGVAVEGVEEVVGVVVVAASGEAQLPGCALWGLLLAAALLLLAATAAAYVAGALP